MIDIYRRYEVPYRVDEGRGGWISTHCPFCRGSADYHLGFNLERGYFHCWRCGSHDVISTLTVVCHIERGMAFDLSRALRSVPSRLLARRDREAQTKITLHRYRHPGDVGPLQPHQQRYLERRGFDPDEIARDWGILGTGPSSWLDHIDYRFRLLIPIRWDGVEVSFQTRDVTGKSDRKYLACPTAREIRHHKHILYGQQKCWGEAGIIVEGVTDAWRVGPQACAVFGIRYRPEQVKAIAKHFRRVFIVFDGEPQAQRQAKRLKTQLWPVLDSEPVVYDLGGGVDPGSLAQDDADHLVRELVG